MQIENIYIAFSKMEYKLRISKNIKNDRGSWLTDMLGENIGGKIKIVEGSPDSYNTRENTPENAEEIFVEKKGENK